MAEGLNRVVLYGNLGADPELRVTQNGGAVLKLRVATTESYLDRNNERQERTEWHHVSLWGKRAEALAKILKKGERVLVEGRISTSSYEKNGEKRYSTEVVATNIILGGGGGGGERRPSARPAQAPEDVDDGAEPAGAGTGSDEIPF
jgi:single-strand DNA-binding protein